MVITVNFKQDDMLAGLLKFLFKGLFIGAITAVCLTAIGTEYFSLTSEDSFEIRDLDLSLLIFPMDASCNPFFVIILIMMLVVVIYTLLEKLIIFILEKIYQCLGSSSRRVQERDPLERQEENP